MCQAEIKFYQSKAGAEMIDWIDVSDPLNVPSGLTCAQAMARFHIRTIDGELVDGGKAFVALWRQLPAFSWLGHAFSVPGMGWVIDFAYNLFLPIRPRLQSLFRGSSS